MDGVHVRAGTLLALAASLLALGACGGDDGGGSEASGADTGVAEEAPRPGGRAASVPKLTARDRIRIRYAEFLEMFENGTPGLACRSFTPAVKRSLTARGTPCVRAVGDAIDSGEYRDLEWPTAPLANVRIEGSGASGSIVRTVGGRLPIVFERVGGKWLISSALDIGP